MCVITPMVRDFPPEQLTLKKKLFPSFLPFTHSLTRPLANNRTIGVGGKRGEREGGRSYACERKLPYSCIHACLHGGGPIGRVMRDPASSWGVTYFPCFPLLSHFFYFFCQFSLSLWNKLLSLDGGGTSGEGLDRPAQNSLFAPLPPTPGLTPPSNGR